MRRLWPWLVGGLTLTLTGCMMGPTALRVSRIEYNKALQLTRDEQLLLNLVRLRYRDVPVFLEVDAVSTQYVIDKSASLNATIIEGATRSGRDQLGIGTHLGFSERPTITYVPLKGEAFVKRMLSPISLDTLVLLANSGWSMDRVIRLTVQRINELDNAATASGPTPEAAPEFEDFAWLSGQLRDLRKMGLGYIGLESRHEAVSDPLAVDAITPEDLLEAAIAGYRFRPAGQDSGYVLTETVRRPMLYLTPEARDSPIAQELRQRLGLESDRTQFEFKLAFGSDASLEPLGQRTAILVATRSLLGTMFYLSQAIRVPARHEADGLVTVTRDQDGERFDWAQVMGDLLCIESSVIPPLDAAVKVFYRHHWFYIADTDLDAKSTFALLAELFDLQAGIETSGGPVLTLPIGG